MNGKARPPRVGPEKLRKPPSRVMNTISPENGQYNTSGVVSPLRGTHKIPARAVKVPESKKAAQRNRRMRSPRNRARVSLSRIALRGFANGGVAVPPLDAGARTKIPKAV